MISGDRLSVPGPCPHPHPLPQNRAASVFHRRFHITFHLGGKGNQKTPTKQVTMTTVDVWLRRTIPASVTKRREDTETNKLFIPVVQARDDDTLNEGISEIRNRMQSLQDCQMYFRATW